MNRGQKFLLLIQEEYPNPMSITFKKNKIHFLDWGEVVKSINCNTSFNERIYC